MSQVQNSFRENSDKDISPFFFLYKVILKKIMLKFLSLNEKGLSFRGMRWIKDSFNKLFKNNMVT